MLQGQRVESQRVDVVIWYILRAQRGSHSYFAAQEYTMWLHGPIGNGPAKLAGAW